MRRLYAITHRVVLFYAVTLSGVKSNRVYLSVMVGVATFPPRINQPKRVSVGECNKLLLFLIHVFFFFCIQFLYVYIAWMRLDDFHPRAMQNIDRLYVRLVQQPCFNWTLSLRPNEHININNDNLYVSTLLNSVPLLLLWRVSFCPLSLVASFFFSFRFLHSFLFGFYYFVFIYCFGFY